MTKAERETVILTNDEDDFVEVSSCQKRVWRKMERAGIPVLRTYEAGGEVHTKFYRVPLDQFHWRVGRKRRAVMTEEQRRLAAERLLQARKRQPTPVET